MGEARASPLNIPHRAERIRDSIIFDVGVMLMALLIIGEAIIAVMKRMQERSLDCMIVCLQHLPPDSSIVPSNAIIISSVGLPEVSFFE